MTSLMKIAVERREKKMIMRKTIVTMMAKKDYNYKEEEEGKEDKDEEEEEDKEKEDEEEDEEEEEEQEVEEEQDYKDDGDIMIPMKQGDDDCNYVNAKKKKMSPVKNEKKTDDDIFDAITDRDLKKKCLNM
jgi:hypothetical protein